MTKILIISKSYPYLGGVESWLDIMYESLCRKGYKVHVCLVKGIKDHNPEVYQKAHPVLKITIIDGRFSSARDRCYLLRKHIKHSHPDIVIPLMCREALIAACQIKKLKGDLKIVLPVHEHNYCAFADIANFGAWIDKIVCMDKLGQSVALELCGISQKQICTIEHGVYKAEKDTRIEVSDKLRIGYCGRLLQSHKRIFDLVECCKKLAKNKKQQFLLKIAGSGPDEERLRRELLQCKSLDISFLGFLSQDELYKIFYPNIDVLLLFSEWETGPLVVWEAMHHGVVPVCSRYLGLRAADFLKNEKNCLLFDVGDFNVAVQKLIRSHNDYDFLVGLSQQAKWDAIQHRSIESMVQKWEELLTEVSSKKNMEHRRIPIGDISEPLPEGRLENIKVPPQIVRMFRQVINKPLAYSGAREEWPFYSESTEQFFSDFIAASLLFDK